MILTVGKGKRNPRGERVEFEDFAGTISRLEGREAWFAFGLFEGDHRAQANWRGAWGVGVDIDYQEAGKHAPVPEGVSIDFRSLPGNYCYLTPRGLRVCFLFAAENNDFGLQRRAQLGAIALFGNVALPDGFQVDVAASRDVSRFFWAPRATVGRQRRTADVESIRLEAYSPADLAALSSEAAPEAASGSARSAYAKTALEAEVRRVTGAPEGERNIALNRAAFSLGQLVGGGELDRGDVEAALLWAATSAGLDRDETLRTIESGIGSGLSSPRSTPSVSVAEAPADDWRSGLIRNERGQIERLDRNLLVLLSDHPDWKDVLAFDERRRLVVLQRRSPTGDEGQVTDIVTKKIRTWLEGQCGWTPAIDLVHMIVAEVADRRRFDPVVDYLQGLEWDGQPRADEWLIRIGGAPDNDYVRAVSAAWLISAVARVLSPGCKADCLLVLEGAQGVRKSTALEVLAGKEHYSDAIPTLGSKESRQHVHSGPWIIEIGELAALRKADHESVKQFISERIDRFRPPYGKLEVVLDRRCIFAATTNAKAWLKDQTGGRRYWPVHVGAVDVARLAEERNQIWAEAVARYRAGEPWHLRGLAEELAAEEQDERRERDAWEDLLATWLGDRDHVKLDEVLDFLSTSRSATGSGRGSAFDWSKQHQERATSILRQLGYRDGRRRVGGVQSRWWSKTVTAPVTGHVTASETSKT